MQSSYSRPIRLMFFPATLLFILIYAAFYVSSFKNQISLFVRPKYSDPNAMPWDETSLIRNESLYGYGLHTRQVYSPEQPRITKSISYKAKVYKGREERGEIKFRIDKQGDIEGTWSADFITGQHHSRRINYTTFNRTDSRYPPNTFRGNVAPSKIYKDENGEDKSKLYIITKGQYRLKAKDMSSSDVHDIMGNIYLTGWIDPNYNATGELTCISMWTENAQTYDWEAAPSDL